jgi:hypothetical protein
MLKGILSISGEPGLYRLAAETKNRIIVESLITAKRMSVSVTAKISSLEDIAVFTHSGDVPLKDIFRKIFEHENGGPSIDPKSPEKDIKQYFGIMVPDYNQERVYFSDIKKVFLWYNILQGKGLLDFNEDEEKAEKPVENQNDAPLSE